MTPPAPPTPARTTVDRPAPFIGWTAADPRSLGLGRIALGVALLWDLLLRAPEMTLFYSNTGLLPNHTVLWQPVVPRLFSIFFMVSLPHEAALAFVACGICFLALAFGFRTRLFHALSLLATLSLHNRVIFVEGEGSVALGALCLWTLFLPLGRRFSVDEVVASMRARPDHLAADLDWARALPADDAPVVSLAVLGLRLQLAAMLLLWFVHRAGATWHDGSALNLVLHQDGNVTRLGLWAREHLSPSLLAALGQAIRVAPAAIGVLLLVPLPRGWGQRLAIALLAAWVVVVAALVNLGNWAVAVLAFAPFFLSIRDWAWLTVRARRRAITRLVIYDGDCGICFFSARVLRRMDCLNRLQTLANDDPASFPPGFSVDQALLERTVLVVDPATGRRWTRSAAFAEIWRVLPGGWPVWLFMRLPLVRQIADWVYEHVAFNRTRISTWLGMAACGVPARAPAVAATAAAPATVEPAAPASDDIWFCRGLRWLRRKPAVLRELGAGLVMLALAGDAFGLHPAVLQMPVGYTGLSQRWALWAPDPPATERFVFVDAQTADGRHVDPFNAAGSRTHELPVTVIPARLGQSALFAEYARRIPERFVYHQAFIEWMQRHPDRTGEPRDRIVSFDATVIDGDAPPRIFRHWAAPPP